ncbi:MAG: hypothetical protein J6S67_21185 [Methanobrevibacter sp.]|nr:hypothetical protein [Methanobrevibacter sp.]
MAINKSVENEYGAEFTYHKLREVRIINDDDAGVQLALTVYSWINKDARIAGKAPTVRRCIVNKADFALNPFYALLKAKFSDFAVSGTDGADDFDNSFKLDNGINTASAEYVMQTGNGDLIERWKEANNG